MKRVLRNLLTVSAIAMFAWTGHAHASVVVTGTRVIYPANQREVTIKVNNAGKAPSLVQAWLDTGDAGISPDKIDVPFTLTPAMFRLDPTKGQTMRLIYTKAPLPTDKETMYWLNVLEIPTKAKPGEGDTNTLQLAFRTRIKVFFRPTGLAGQPDDAPAQVKWQVVQKPDGYHLKGSNPTPYFANYGEVQLVSGGQTLTAGGGYIPPGESAEFPVAGLKGWPGAGAQVQYKFINDYGATVTGQAPAASAN